MIYASWLIYIDINLKHHLSVQDRLTLINVFVFLFFICRKLRITNS